MSNLLTQVAIEPQAKCTKNPRQYNMCPYCGSRKKREARACRVCIIPRKKKQSKHSTQRPIVVQPDDLSIRLIALTLAQVTVVDAIDYDRIMYFNWMAVKAKTICGFAAVSGGVERVDGKQATTRLANFILGVPRDVYVDHVDGDGLNNRRDNLRIATKQQNSWNRRLNTRNTSGYIGVHPQKFRATITVNGKHIHLGFFSNPIHAAKARDMAAIKHFGEFAKLNFPELLDTYRAKSSHELAPRQS